MLPQGVSQAYISNIVIPNDHTSTLEPALPARGGNEVGGGENPGEMPCLGPRCRSLEYVWEGGDGVCNLQ